MSKKPILATIALLMVVLFALSILPTKAWDYTDGTPSDTLYEEFGPRADKLLIKLYESDTAEFDALGLGEIDITDWPLTKPYYDTYTTPPENESIAVMSYGAEFGLFLLDINNNNESLMPDGSPNPVFPNPLGSTTDPEAIAFRQAIWHLHDKPTWLPEIIGEGFYYDLYTVIPPSFGAYSLPMENPYPYDPDAAIALLEANGFPWHDDDADGVMDPGERFWDRNRNGVHDPGEDLVIKFFIRTDHPHRNMMGDKLADELNKIGIAVERIYGPVLEAVVHWFFNKEVHLYTAGWGLGVDPDFVILWNSYFFWHPGFCYNTGYVNDPLLDEYSWNVFFANTIDEAVTNCHAFQERFAEIAAAVPWWSYSGSKGVYRTYTGGTAGELTGDEEDKYRGKYWDGLVNVQGYGVDSGFTFLNMHPRGYEFGDGSMTIRWAFKTAELKSFNPAYAEWVWEWAVLGLIYESLLYRNPYDLSDIKPWLAESYEVGIYDHPVYGPCTKVRFTLRPDIYWADGTPLTMADVYFTFVEMDDILIGRGFPPPWWYSTVAYMLSFSIVDAYNFEVLLSIKSVYATMMPGGMLILPKHIWKPIAEEHPQPTDPAPDPNEIGSGPWRLAEYVAYSHVLMIANKPGTTVQVSSPYHEGSVPITSPGYFRFNPIDELVTVVDPPELAGLHKLPLSPVTLNLTIKNRAQYLDVTGNYTVTCTLPNGTVIEKTYENLLLGPQDVFEDTIFSGTPPAGLITIHIQNEIKIDGITVTSDIWIYFWATITEDISGSTWYDDAGLGDYPYKSELETPDGKVNIRDVALAARAFGSYPGHERWSTLADITGDYQVNIRDIASIAAKFGWVG